MTRRFRISLAPLGGGPENHLSGMKNGSAPHHPLTVLATICLILLAPQSARLSCWGFGCGGMYGPLTLDYNERARGLTLVVSLWLPPQRILKCSTKVCGHMHSTTRTDRSEPKDNGSRGHSNVQEWPKIPGGLTKDLHKT